MSARQGSRASLPKWVLSTQLGARPAAERRRFADAQPRWSRATVVSPPGPCTVPPSTAVKHEEDKEAELAKVPT